MNGPKVSIVIVSWNCKKDVLECLESLRNQNIERQIILVDNNSSDNTVSTVKQEFLEVEVIAMSANSGFAAGCNRGAQVATAPWLLLLNPDTIVPPQALKKWLEWAQQRPGLGASGPKLVNSDSSPQPSVRRFPSFLYCLIIMLKLHRLFPTTLNKYLCHDFDYNRESEVDQIMGAAILTPAKIYKSLNGLDENYFLWFEEVDYCRRLYEHRLKVIYTPTIEIIHKGGQSFIQLSTPQKQKLFNRSILYYSRRHFNVWQNLILWCVSPIAWLIAGLGLLVSKKTLAKAQSGWYRK